MPLLAQSHVPWHNVHTRPGLKKAPNECAVITSPYTSEQLWLVNGLRRPCSARSCPYRINVLILVKSRNDLLDSEAIPNCSVTKYCFGANTSVNRTKCNYSPSDSASPFSQTPPAKATRIPVKGTLVFASTKAWPKSKGSGTLEGRMFLPASMRRFQELHRNCVLGCVSVSVRCVSRAVENRGS